MIKGGSERSEMNPVTVLNGGTGRRNSAKKVYTRYPAKRVEFRRLKQGQSKNRGQRKKHSEIWKRDFKKKTVS